MNSDPDRFWKKMALTMQRAKELHHPTGEEAEHELESVAAAPLSDSEIDSLVALVTSGKGKEERPLPDDISWSLDMSTEEVASDALVLNRNKGDDDPEIEELLKRLRKEAFEQDKDEEDQT